MKYCPWIFMICLMIQASKSENQCFPWKDNLHHGELNCTNKNRENSICKLKCTGPGYGLYPKISSRIKCRPKGWNKPFPCCNKPCPPYTKADFYIALDISSTLSSKNWDYVKRGVESLISPFSFSVNYTQVAVVPYSSTIHKQHIIMLDDFSNNKTGFIEAFRRIQQEGGNQTIVEAAKMVHEGKNIGKALKYIRRKMMKHSNGKREGYPDIVIIPTDGKSDDDFKRPSRALRKIGAQIFVLATPRANEEVDEQALFDIAGRKEYRHVLIYRDLESSSDFAFTLIDKACGSPC